MSEFLFFLADLAGFTREGLVCAVYVVVLAVLFVVAAVLYFNAAGI
jgi:hypothetical protein